VGTTKGFSQRPTKGGEISWLRPEKKKQKAGFWLGGGGSSPLLYVFHGARDIFVISFITGKTREKRPIPDHHPSSSFWEKREIWRMMNFLLKIIRGGTGG